MIYSAKGKVLFVHVSRTAGTSISNFLYQHFSDTEQLIGQHDPIAALLPISTVDLNSIYSFTVVRNPWDRLASWFNLINKLPQINGEPVSSELHQTETFQFEFESFVETWLKESWIVDSVEHSRASQFSHVCNGDGDILVDKVCRYESIDRDFLEVTKHIGINDTLTHRVNASSPLDYRQYYNRNSKDMVSTFCKDDISHFNYQF